MALSAGDIDVSDNRDGNAQGARDRTDVADLMNSNAISKMPREIMLRYWKREFRDDAQHSQPWRKEAEDDFNFVAGRQWTPDEKSQLNEQRRPEIVFNRALLMIKAVAGFEINSRHEIQFLPRNTEDTEVNELLTGASQWMGQNSDAEDEQSEAFGHMCICGMGWTEQAMDYEIERAGKYIEPWLSPLEMYWDRKARKKNLSDSRRMYHLKRMTLADARDLCPKPGGGEYDRIELDARWAVGINPEEQTKTLEEKRRREENALDNFTEPLEVYVLRVQWWEREDYWLVADPVANKMHELTLEEYAELQKCRKIIAKLAPDVQSPPFESVKLTRRVYKQVFIGSQILGEVEDCPNKDGFSFNCMTGESDFNKGTWYGLIRLMRDPQKWGNKWLSQTLHIMNSQAKGGIFYEEDFPVDVRKFEEDYAKPNAATKVKKGALSGQNPKWAQKPVAQFPTGFYQLMEFAISSIRDVIGVNLELLGQRDENQPGILEAQRKQAGMTVLATMFDSLRRFRKMVGRGRLYIIQNYLSDGRIIRITGSTGSPQAVKLMRDKTAGEYDVIVDDAPTSPNQKEANWAIIAPMLPMFKDQLAQMPELLVEILEYSPLPSRLVKILRTLITNPDPQKAADAAQAKELSIAALVAKITRDQAAAAKDNAAAGKDQETGIYDIAAAQKMLAEIGLTNAQTDHTHARADEARAGADHLRAQLPGLHADHMAAHVDTAIKALTPIPHAPPPMPEPAGAGGAPGAGGV